MARIIAGVASSHVPAIGAAIDNKQTEAVLRRDYNRMLELGGNIYFTAKLGATDGHSFRHLAATMTGATQEDYADMMIKGGRSVEGNRSRSGRSGVGSILGEQGKPKAANKAKAVKAKAGKSKTAKSKSAKSKSTKSKSKAKRK